MIERARQAELLGFDEFWVIEDCFFTSGPTLAAAALASTADITVGIGILPVVARNAAVTAMELATLAELAPGRLHAGLGHGVQSWMAQMNERVASPLTVLEETFTAVRSLLVGETVTVDGRYVTLDQVALEPAPAVPPLLSAGVRGPKSMEVAGRCADGVILADFVSADYVRAVREQTGNDDHRITVFATIGIGEGAELEAIKQGVGAFLAGVAVDAPISLRTAPCWPRLSAEAERTSWAEAVTTLSDDEWTQIAAVGTPDQAASYVRSLIEAGADAVTFFPSPFDPIEDSEAIAATLLPLLA